MDIAGGRRGVCMLISEIAFKRAREARLCVWCCTSTSGVACTGPSRREAATLHSRDQQCHHLLLRNRAAAVESLGETATMRLWRADIYAEPRDPKSLHPPSQHKKKPITSIYSVQYTALLSEVLGPGPRIRMPWILVSIHKK